MDVIGYWQITDVITEPTKPLVLHRLPNTAETPNVPLPPVLRDSHTYHAPGPLVDDFYQSEVEHLLVLLCVVQTTLVLTSVDLHRDPSQLQCTLRRPAHTGR